jgi:hypothetical protein
MRGREQNKEIWGHLLGPAILLLASVALAIPGNLGHDAAPSSVQTVALSVQRDVADLRELADAGGCGLVSAAAEADRMSAGFFRIMLGFSQALDQVSRDASAFLDWVENLMTHDGLDALDVVAEGVSEWFAGSLDSPECPDDGPVQGPVEIPDSPCQA